MANKDIKFLQQQADGSFLEKVVTPTAGQFLKFNASTCDPESAAVAAGGGGGTCQGTSPNTLNIQASCEGSVAGAARGENSVDLQTTRACCTQVASGVGSVIGGGSGNTASGNCSTVSGGYGNTSSGYASTVGGGCANTASHFSTVSGGYGNTASGDYSGILGGRCNTTSGYADSFIIGSNLTATAACTTFVNNLCVAGSIYGTINVSGCSVAVASYASYAESAYSADNVVVVDGGVGITYRRCNNNSAYGFYSTLKIGRAHV